MSDNQIQPTSNTNLTNVLQQASNLNQLQNAAFKRTSYRSSVTRKTPAGIVLMLDQSGSMRKLWKDEINMAARLAQIVNEYLDSLFIKANKAPVRDYYQVAIIGYGSKNELGENVDFAWQGSLKGKDWVWVSEWADSYLRKTESRCEVKLPFGVREQVTVRKEWIDPVCDGGSTPMKAAFEKAEEVMIEWALRHPDSHPPILFNITDGMPTDVKDSSELLIVTDRIKAIQTNDGDALIYNLLLSDGDTLAFPEDDQNQNWESDNHQMLFQASSVLPFHLRERAYQVYREERLQQNPTRCVLLNARLDELIQLLNIGTPVTPIRSL